MTAAEEFKAAASRMREDWPGCCGVGDVCCESVAFHQAVADWLDRAALSYMAHFVYVNEEQALVVARTYLGGVS